MRMSRPASDIEVARRDIGVVGKLAEGWLAGRGLGAFQLGVAMHLRL
jgi:hypothetical protein